MTHSAPDWAPLTLSDAGVWEVEPGWVREHCSRLQIVDVREPNEFVGPLGHIEGSKLIPLGMLTARTGECDPSLPTVMVCRSGARSGRATLFLARMGFAKVANMTGGMLRWRAEGHPVEDANA